VTEKTEMALLPDGKGIDGSAATGGFQNGISGKAWGAGGFFEIEKTLDDARPKWIGRF
jgi:hypothetical protein